MPYPGLAPELDIRSGMGGWEPYALDTPNDRLLPFVLSRRALPGNASWVSCAWIEHADTKDRIATLVPTGAPVRPAVVPPLGLVFTKLRDHDTEHFTYDGALIPGLDVPCGIPLRLIVDNAYQSPRFFALKPASALRESHLLLEWYHGGPLQGVPYGRGFRQHFYLDNGSLQYLDPRSEEATTKDPDTSAERTLSLTLFAQAAFAIGPVPAYLAEALSAARAPRFFLAGGEIWKLQSVKTTSTAPDGGRWSVAGTLESEEPLLSRGCQLPALTPTVYDPVADAPRGWRCGDSSDVASDYRPTGIFTCQLNTVYLNTGYVLETYRDLNPYSPTFGLEEQRVSATQDLARCPLPFYSKALTVSARRDNCGSGYVGSSVDFTLAAGAYVSNLSQADADAKAKAYADSQKQDNANASGTCQLSTPSTYEATYNANGCFSGFMANVNDPTDVRGATEAEYNQYRTQNAGSDGRDCPSYN